jgi:hypothetical protein
MTKAHCKDKKQNVDNIITLELISTNHENVVFIAEIAITMNTIKFLASRQKFIHALFFNPKLSSSKITFYTRLDDILVMLKIFPHQLIALDKKIA